MPSRSVVEAMLAREEELRLCDETQRSFFAARRDPEGVFNVVADLQRRVAREFGLAERVGLAALRNAEDWVGVEKAKELSLYRRYNKCRDGPLREGDRAPLESVRPLVEVLDDEHSDCARAVAIAEYPRRSLSEIAAASSRPLVLVAGSYS